MVLKSLSKLFTLFILLILLPSCAAEQPVVKQRFVWPPPPNPPRIEWLANYSSQLDLQKSSFQIFREAIVGEDTPIKLKRPIEARMDSVLNKLYVADMDAQMVFIFDRKENELRNIDFSPVLGKISGIKPVSMTLDNSGNSYILDAFRKTIFVFNSNEKYIKSINLSSFCDVPVSIVYDSINNRIYVADAKKNIITALDTDGKKLFDFGKAGDEIGSFNRPVGMAVNSKGEIIVADTFNARVQIFNSNGQFLRTFGQRGDGDTDFQLIKGVALDPDGNIYVTDSRSNSIKIFTTNGVPLLVFGGYYAAATTGKIAAGGFALPVGIDIDKNGIISVVDQLNARIQLFQYIPEAPSNSAK